MDCNFVVEKGESCIIESKESECIEKITGTIDMKERLEYYIRFKDNSVYQRWIKDFDWRKIYIRELELIKLSLNSIIGKLRHIKIDREFKYENKTSFYMNL